MYIAKISFEEIPKIGFAHHFHTDNYCFSYSKMNKSLEIVYVASGNIEAELYGQKLLIPERSIFVLFRHLPITIRSIGEKPQAHCTVQAEFDFSFSLLSNTSSAQIGGGLLIPFITESCNETEEIKRELFSIVSDMGISREENSFMCSLKILNIMRKLDQLARKKNFCDEPKSSIIIHKVKRYILMNTDKPISLSDIGNELNLSPAYINQVFKNDVGIPIKHYINEEKAKRIAELIQTRSLSFKTACSNVGINDVSYGYRLFKKHMGITPGKFMSGDMHL